MNLIIANVIERFRALIAILVIIFIMGIWTFYKIPKESAPDITIPIVIVNVHQEGISPEDAERLLVRPIEQRLRTIDGIKELKASAFEDGANVVVEFIAGHNINRALADIRAQVELAKPDLPNDADEPEIKELSFSQFPVLVVQLSGNVPERTLYKLATDLRDNIETSIPSVLEAQVVGNREDVVEILIDPMKTEAYGLVFEEVIERVKRNNVVISSGSLETKRGKFSIKLQGLLENVKDIEDLPIIVNQDRVLTFKDLAEIRKTYKDPLNIARDRGHSAVAIEITKRAGENIIETVGKVRELVDLEVKKASSNIKVSYAQDQSNKILDMLNDLKDNLIFALLLVMAIIFYAMGWRSALLVGLSVPGSFLVGVLAISFLGYTMNIVVLFSFILAVGMLVDAAIIVVEYADRKINEGSGRKAAYLEAAQRMAWPVITSTITTLVVFAPLLFWPGIVGEFMKFLPLTLIATLSASVIMAIFFIPAIGSILGGSAVFDKSKINDFKLMEKGNLEHLHGPIKYYYNLLNFILDFPKQVVIMAGIFTLSVFAIYMIFGRGIEFFPNVEPEQAAVNIYARGNFSLKEQDDLVKKVEQELLGMEELSSVYTSVGSGRDDKDSREDQIGVINIEFQNWQKRRSVAKIAEDIIAKVAHIPGIKVEIQQDKPGPSQGKPIEIDIKGLDQKKLSFYARMVEEKLKSIQGVKNIEDNLPVPGIRWKVDVNRKEASKYGVDTSMIGAAVRLVTNGYKIGTYRPDDVRDEVDIVLRYEQDYRNLDQLKRLRVRTNEGVVPIINFISITPEAKVGFIYRSDGSPVRTVKADVESGVLADDVIRELKVLIQPLIEKGEVKIQIKGEDEDQREAQSFLIKAFLIAIFVIVIILLIQFNSLFSMSLIISAILMSTTGVLIGLLIRGMAFGIVMGGIGVIALSGIIVNNNIILIDTFDRLKAKSRNIRKAILRTALMRLRPILLTQITTIMGLIPIMFGININFLKMDVTYGAPATQWWVMLATCIVFGLLFGSILTLIVTPAALMWRENMARKKTPPSWTEFKNRLGPIFIHVLQKLPAYKTRI